LRWHSPPRNLMATVSDRTAIDPGNLTGGIARMTWLPGRKRLSRQGARPPDGVSGVTGQRTWEPLPLGPMIAWKAATRCGLSGCERRARDKATFYRGRGPWTAGLEDGARKRPASFLVALRISTLVASFPQQEITRATGIAVGRE